MASAISPNCLLSGQSALVTGAGAGIGRAIAQAMAAAGARVVVNDLPAKRRAAEATAATIEAAGGKVSVICADVSNEADVVTMLETASPLDILVNNAGTEALGPVETLSLATWQATIDVNLTGAFLCSREAVRLFKRQGCERAASASCGKILFVSSIHEAFARPNTAAYAAAKAGTMMLMRTLALEAGPFGIRVNCVCPGATNTDRLAAVMADPDAAAALAHSIPLQRIAEPEDIARAAVWLASDQAEYIHGASLFIDGGMSLQMNARRFPSGFRHRVAAAVRRRLSLR